MERLLRRLLPMLLVFWAGCDRSDGQTPASEPTSEAASSAQPSPAAKREAETVEAKTVEPPATAIPPKADPPKPPEPDLPGMAITLPTKPTFPKSSAPTRYPDGAWSIHGLRQDLDKNIADGNAGTEVVMRATVQEVYVPPTCPSSGTCPPPKQPHVWVVDDAAERGKRRAMLVVNYAFQIPMWDAKRWASEPEIVLEVGKEYRFKGLFKQFSDTGFAAHNGVFEFRALETIGADGKSVWRFPPGAPWHPVEVLRIEEASAVLIEKAAAAR